MTRADVRPTRASTAGPLTGVRVVFTGTAAHVANFESRVRALGGEPLIAPAIAIAPVTSWSEADDALRSATTYDWLVFTSANAVRALTDRADAIGVSRAVLCARRLAVVGPSTAVAAASMLRSPDVVPEIHTAAALAAEMPDVRNRRVLFPRGELAGTALADGLRLRGAIVEEVVVYRTVAGPGIETIVAGLLEGTIGVLLFASASAVRFVADALAAAGDASASPHPATSPGWPTVVCIGPVTADAAHHAGFRPVAVAESATLAELIDTAARALAKRRDDSRMT